MLTDNIFRHDDCTDIALCFNFAQAVFGSCRYWKDLNKKQYTQLRESFPGHINAYLKFKPQMTYEEIFRFYSSYF